MFISFEGIDGSGKTTQIKNTSEYLKSLGYDVLMLREPGGTEFSEYIREILLSKKFEINSVSELMLFEAARADLIEKIIKPALLGGKFVLTDRFFDSTTAYQGYGRQLNLDHVINSNKLATNGIVPDLTFYLKLPLEIAYQRAKHRNSDRIESAGDEFFKRVINGFDELAVNEPERIKVIDCTDNAEITFNYIKDILNKKIIIKN